jgi:hypothetical protein
VLPEGARFACAAAFKAPATRGLAERGYAVVLTVGDQERSLRGGHAEHAFMLPNPVYSLP